MMLRYISTKGITLADVGLFEDALAAFDRAIEIKPDFWIVHDVINLEPWQILSESLISY
jgi:hypothetical protein